MHLIHGVSVDPSNPYQNQDITINYDGLLQKSGADQVSALWSGWLAKSCHSANDAQSDRRLPFHD